MLLSAGANVNNTPQDEDGETALMLTTELGDEHDAEAMMRLLLSAGADANKQSKYGRTALMLAVKKGGALARVRVRMLLSAGADVNMRDKYGETALMIAAGSGDEHAEAMVRALLEHDGHVSVNARDEYGMTALMMLAVSKGERVEAMMRVLLEAGAAADEQNREGWTALMFAAWKGGEHAEGMVRLLVARGATHRTKLHPDTPPTIRAYVEGARYWTPLHRAADARDADALRECLQFHRPNATVETEHPDMRTALAIAGSAEYPTARPVCGECLALLHLPS